MQRVGRHHPWSALWTLLALIAAAALPFGSVANAAPPTTICPTFEEGGPECGLDISAPQSVAAGQPFTVTVFLTDGNESPTFLSPKDPCTSRVVVTLDVYITEGPAFATYTANANKGVATFTVGGLPSTSFVELNATAVQTAGSCNYNYDAVNVEVVTVNAGQPIFPCPADVSCTQVTNNDTGGGSAATLFADEGSFDAAFTPLVPEDAAACGRSPADPSANPALSFEYFGSSTKTVVFALSPDLIANGIGRYAVCWASNNPFTTLDGGQAVAVPGGLFAGLLPNCSPHTPAPCVLFQTSTQHNGGFFGVSAPATDPRGWVGGP